MRKRFLIYPIYIILMMFLSQDVISQDSLFYEDPISEGVYNEVVNEVTFDKTKKALRPKKRKKKPPKEQKDLDIPDISWYDALGFLEVIAYIVIAILGFGLLFFIFSNLEPDKNIMAKSDPDYIEDIEEVDTDAGYNEALRNGDYRGAIRMQFLKVLQILSHNESIDWQPEKTNRQYAKEIHSQSKKASFRMLARIYENVWYGNHIIDREQFSELDYHFIKYIKSES